MATASVGTPYSTSTRKENESDDVTLDTVRADSLSGIDDDNDEASEQQGLRQEMESVIISDTPPPKEVDLNFLLNSMAAARVTKSCIPVSRSAVDQQAHMEAMLKQMESLGDAACNDRFEPRGCSSSDDEDAGDVPDLDDYHGENRVSTPMQYKSAPYTIARATEMVAAALMLWSRYLVNVVDRKGKLQKRLEGRKTLLLTSGEEIAKLATKPESLTVVAAGSAYYAMTNISPEELELAMTAFARPEIALASFVFFLGCFRYFDSKSTLTN